jgi:hypothetical protein
LDIDAKKLAGKVTLQVTIRRGHQWQWRVKVGRWLIRLAGLIMWTPVEVKFKWKA